MKSFLLVWLSCCALFAKAPEPLEIQLWPKTTSTNPEDNASITVYLPEKEKAVAAGVMVIPGGSFLIRCEDHEGRQPARWLAERGIAAFVVHYRLIPRFTMREELDDVRRAAQVIRSRAEEFGIKRLGMIGFSAGAYLTGEAALKPFKANPSANDPIEKAGGDLDFMGLVYGAPGGTNDPVVGFNRFFADQVGMEEWKELTATTPDQIAKAPPAFMFCTVEDRGAARKMGEFHLELLRRGVSSEAHFFASGPHGVGFAQGDPVLGAWPDLFLNWMRAREFLNEEPGLEVRGIAKVDGKPLELGYVVLKPKSGSSPARTAYVFNRSGEKGGFRLAPGQGLVPGKYEATIFQMAAKWNSVWAEPLLTQIQSKLLQGGKLSEEEIAKWKSWAETRNYRATLPDLKRLRPQDTEVTSQNAQNLVIEGNAD